MCVQSYHTKASESAADDVSKDDEEENDDEDDDKMSSVPDMDPERLKAFNVGHGMQTVISESIPRIGAQ